MPDTLADPVADVRAAPARRVAVVVNGSAGALLERPDAHAAMERAFADAGLQPDFVPRDAGTLPERVRLAQQSGAEMVVVAGGDGTVACAAQALAGTDTVLGVLPFGTMNLLAKDLGIPVGDEAAAIRVLADGTARNIDVAEVNGHVFLCASMLGLPTKLARYREAQRKEGNRLAGWLRFGRAALRAMRHPLPGRFTMRLGDAAPVRLRVPTITVAANALDETADHVFARARLDGGELAVYVVEQMHLADVLRLGVRFLRGAWRRDPVIQEHRATRVTISRRRRRMRVMNDGEVFRLDPPLEYRIRPGALRVMAPRPEAAAAS